MIIETGELRPVARVSRPGWTRPLVAAVAALTVAMGSVVGVYVVGGRAGSGPGQLATWAPADAAMYMEADLSLPGAQRANLEALLGRWPALDADLVLGDGFAGWVDGMLGEASAPVSYRDDMAPWLTGAYAFVLPSWPEMSSAGGSSMRHAVPEMVAVIGSRDRAAATAFTDLLRGRATEQGSTFSSATVDGVTVWSLGKGGALSHGMANAEMAYAVADGAVLVGTGSDAISVALAAHGGGASLAAEAEVARLARALPAERVAFAAVDARTLLDQLATELGPAYADLAASTGGRVVMAVSLEADRLVTTTVSDAPTGTFAPQALSEPLARRIPSDALAYGAIPQLGKGFRAGIEAMLSSTASNPSTAGMVREWANAFQSAAGFPLDELLSWAGDSAFFVSWDGGQPSGGVVILTSDRAAAKDQVDRLVHALITVAASSGTDLSVTSEQVNGVPVTRITGPVAQGGTPVIEIAVTADSVVMTVGAGSAARVIGLDAGASLGASTRFASAIQAVGGSATTPSLFIDLAGIVTAVASQVPADAASSFDMFVRPNLAPVDHLAAAAHVENGLLVSRMDLVLR